MVHIRHVINTLLINAKKVRGDLPIGVHFNAEKGKYRATMNFMGNNIKLGRFNTAEEAFKRYKDYKEAFIEDMAGRHKYILSDKVYEAMMNWKIDDWFIINKVKI